MKLRVGRRAQKQAETMEGWWPQTNNHIYFVIDEESATVCVYAVWGAPKGSTPKL